MLIAWLLLLCTIFLETVATSLLNASNGFKEPLPGVAAMFLYILCFFLLSHVLRTIPVGVAYAVWSGVGIVLVALIGWILFRQQLPPISIAGIILILIGAILASIGTTHH